MKRTTLIILLTIFSIAVFAQDAKKGKHLNNILSNTKISGQWFMSYYWNPTDTVQEFRLKRGYLTVKSKLSNRLSVRYTQDITMDKEGGDAGNIELKVKYMYLKLKLDDLAFITNQHLEIGLVHRAWIDFDSKINGYRLQDKMFADKNKIINSADKGVSWHGLLGGKLDEKYRKNVSSAYPGRYGSFSVGVFNGGGYSAMENNSNKTIETRLSLRPFPNFLPGVQLSHAFAYGLSNVDNNNATFAMNIFALSTQSRYHTLHAQYYMGKGGYGDKYVDSIGNSFDNNGFSVIGEVKMPGVPVRLFSRYDYFESEAKANKPKKTFTAGLAYFFLKHKLLAYYSNVNFKGKTENIFELGLEIKF